MTTAVVFDEISKRYPRGGPGYTSLRQNITTRVRDLVRRTDRPGDRRRGAEALDRVSLQINQGESVAIIGPNGAGKTTALKLIARISYPTGGRLRVRGRVGALIEVGSGLHPELSGRENIWLYGQILGLSRAELRRRFDTIVGFAELEDVLDRQLKMYSSGMQLRLGFAIASHLDPDVLVVDEALAVGDGAFQAKCVERMANLVSEGRTLIFVSHTLPVVREVCQRAYLLDKGRLVFEGRSDEVVDHYLKSVANVMMERQSRDELIEVRAVRVRPLGGSNSRLRTGDPVRLEFDINVASLLEDAALGIGITDGRPGNLIALTMVSTGESVRLRPGKHMLTCMIESLPLLPSAYEVWFAASSQKTAQHYTKAKAVSTLLVYEGPESRRRDSLFTSTGGFGPVHVDYEMDVQTREDVVDTRHAE